MTDSPIERLGAYVHRAAIAAGYAIDRPRNGELSRLAADSGMSITTLHRLLSGDRMPDPRYLAQLARVLDVPAAELFIEAGILSAADLQPRPVTRPLTPDEAADALGIHDEASRGILKEALRKIRGRDSATEVAEEGSA